MISQYFIQSLRFSLPGGLPNGRAPRMMLVFAALHIDADGKFYSRSHDAVIRVYDEAGNMIGTHEHAGEFKKL
jgi:hypothetical protein